MHTTARLPGHGGDMPQAPVMRSPHRNAVRATDPAAEKGKGFYQGLSASSVGLELGIAVTLGVFIGLWLDDELGTSPWLLLLFIAFGLVAGFRGVLRAVAREDRRAAAQAARDAAPDEVDDHG
jgi:ATP synthase protein I